MLRVTTQHIQNNNVNNCNDLMYTVNNNVTTKHIYNIEILTLI